MRLYTYNCSCGYTGMFNTVSNESSMSVLTWNTYDNEQPLCISDVYIFLTFDSIPVALWRTIKVISVK